MAQRTREAILDHVLLAIHRLVLLKLIRESVSRGEGHVRSIHDIIADAPPVMLTAAIAAVQQLAELPADTLQSRIDDYQYIIIESYEDAGWFDVNCDDTFDYAPIDVYARHFMAIRTSTLNPDHPPSRHLRDMTNYLTNREVRCSRALVGQLLAHLRDDPLMRLPYSRKEYKRAIRTMPSKIISISYRERAPKTLNPRLYNSIRRLHAPAQTLASRDAAAPGIIKPTAKRPSDPVNPPAKHQAVSRVDYYTTQDEIGGIKRQYCFAYGLKIAIPHCGPTTVIKFANVIDQIGDVPSLDPVPRPPGKYYLAHTDEIGDIYGIIVIRPGIDIDQLKSTTIE